MKFTLKIFFILLCSSIFSPAKSQSWLWAKSCADSSGSVTESVATDQFGNVYVTGNFYSSNFTIGTTVLTNAGMSDIFLAKYDASGNVLWAKSVGGIYDDESYDVAVDGSGNIFITGTYMSPTITFGTTTFNNNSSSYDLFLAKYDNSGNVIWARHTDDPSDEHATSVATDPSGNVFITGYFNSPALAFGTDTVYNPYAMGYIFLTKYDASGNVLWANSAGGVIDNASFCVETDISGNVFITGTFWCGTIWFDTITLNTSSNNNYDFFLAKYNGAGNIQWAKAVGNFSDEYGFGITTDQSGNIFVTGQFGSDTVMFDNDTLINSTPSSLQSDVFLTKYNSAGTALWAKGFGGTGDDEGLSVSKNGAGEVYLTGMFESPQIIFDSDTLLQPAGSTRPMFIAMFDQTGNVICASSLKSGGSPQTYESPYGGVTSNASGDVYVGGIYSGTNFVIGPDTLHSNSSFYADFYVAKFSCTTNNINQTQNPTQSINVFPNPTTGEFILAGNFKFNSQLHLYNLFGQEMIKPIELPQGNQNIPIKINLEEGIYIYRIVSGNEILQEEKLVIVK